MGDRAEAAYVGAREVIEMVGMDRETLRTIAALVLVLASRGLAGACPEIVDRILNGP